MTDVAINFEEVSIDLDFIELDQGDPGSMRWRVNLELRHPTGRFSYYADDIWFETEMWDAFVHEIAASVPLCAKFYDSSNYFVVYVERKDRYFEIEITACEPIISRGSITLSAKLRAELDSNVFEKMRDSFTAYPKFW